MSEFARGLALDTIGTAPRTVELQATPAERAALADRFGWLGVEALQAEAQVQQVAGGVAVAGHVRATVVQPCVVTGEGVREAVDEPFALRFVHRIEGDDADVEEVELGAGELDTLPIEGGAIDLGEAVAQTLALAVDPFPRAPAAADRLKEAGVLSEDEARDQGSPFAALKGLLKG